MFSQAASLPTQPRVHFKVREHASLITILGMRRAKRREHEPETRSSRSGSGLLLKILGPCSHLVPLINHALPPSFLALGYEVTWNHTRPKLSRGVPVQQFARRPPTPIGAFCGRCQQSLLLPMSVLGGSSLNFEAYARGHSIVVPGRATWFLAAHRRVLHNG